MTNTPPADDAPAGPGPVLDADVLIVGAGPAGLGLANLLGVMDNCGHWPQYEDADTFNRIHLDFLLGRN